MSGDLKGVTRQTSSAITAIGSQLRGMMAGLGLIGLGATFAAAGREAANFEDTMIFVRANARLLGKDGEAAFKRLEAAARKMGATTRFTAVQAAQGLNMLVLGGLNAEDAIGALPAVLDLAASTTLQFGQAAKIVVNNMIKFNLAAKDTGRIADFMSSGQSRAQTEAYLLAEALDGLGSIAADVGVSFRDTTALMVGMARASVFGGEAGTAMAIAIGRLINPPKETADALKELNIQVRDFTDAGGALDLIKMLKAIALAMPDDKVERSAKALELFGQRGRKITGILTLLKRGNFVEDTAKGLEEDIGRAARVAAARMDTFIGILLRAKSALSEFAITALTPVLKGMKPLIGLITKMTGIMSFATQQFFNLDKALGGMISKTIVASTAVLALVKAIQLIGPAAKLAGIAIRLATLSTGWFALVAVIGTAVAGLITLVQWLRKTDAVQKTIKDSAIKFRMAWERIKEAFRVIERAIIQALNSILKKTEEIIGITLPELEATVMGVMQSAVRFVANFVLDASEWFVVLVNNWGKSWRAMELAVMAGLSFIADVFQNTLDQLPRITGFALRKVMNIWHDLAEAILKLMIEAIAGIAIAMLDLPKLMEAGIKKGKKGVAAAAKEIGDEAKKGIDKIKNEFILGVIGVKPDWEKLWELSPRTKTYIAALKKILAELGKAKKELELGRGDLFKKPPPKKPGAPEVLGLPAAAGPAGAGFGGAKRAGFREFGRQIQDALMENKLENKKVKLMEKNNQQNKEVIAAIKEVNPGLV